jgi:hypothetical protein
MPKSNHYILKYGDWKFGQGNVFVCTLHQPPFAFPAPKKKRKCINASVQTHLCIYTDGKFFIFYFLFYFSASVRMQSRIRAGEPRVHADALGSTRTHACICADATIYPRGNLKTDATVRLSHERPSSHRPRPRPPA